MSGAGILFISFDEAPSRRYGVLGISTRGEGVELPGGGHDDGDADLTWTAAREAVEEIGLRPEFTRLISDHIKKNDYHVTLEKYNYILYIVKIGSFDFTTANLAASTRLLKYAEMDEPQRKTASHLVEMMGYVPFNIWEGLQGRECNIEGRAIRERDCTLLMRDDLIEMVLAMSRTDDTPVFSPPFIFEQTLTKKILSKKIGGWFLTRMFEDTDDGLKKRIRRGMSVGVGTTTTTDRPKTPKNVPRRRIAKPKTRSDDDDDDDDDDDVKEITGRVKHVTLTEKEVMEPPDRAIYICPSCEKTYKSKGGIIKHMGSCKLPPAEKKEKKEKNKNEKKKTM